MGGACDGKVGMSNCGIRGKQGGEAGLGVKPDLHANYFSVNESKASGRTRSQPGQGKAHVFRLRSNGLLHFPANKQSPRVQSESTLPDRSLGRLRRVGEQERQRCAHENHAGRSLNLEPPRVSRAAETPDYHMMRVARAQCYFRQCFQTPVLRANRPHHANNAATGYRCEAR